MILKVFCIFLVLFFFCSATLAETVYISDKSQFIDVVNKAKSGITFDDHIVLGTDLDFEDDTLRGVVEKLPLGMTNATHCTPFSGTFDGNKHSLKNLKLANPYSGFICDARNAVIKNLTIDKSCSFSGNVIGGLVVNVTGNITIENVHMFGSLNASGITGGIIGIVSDLDGSSVVVENSGFHGVIVRSEAGSASLFYGGFIGYMVYCTKSSLYLSKNLNDGVINTTFAYLQSDPHVSSIGGFMGHFSDNVKMDVVVSDCENHVQIVNEWADDSNSYFFGGLFGRILGSELRVKVERTVSQALFNVSSNTVTYAGGYIAHMSTINATVIMTENTNDCEMFLTVRTEKLFAAGYICYFTDSGKIETVFQSNTNNGDIRMKGLISPSSLEGGGFIAYCFFSDSRGFRFNNNTNNGNLIAENSEVDANCYLGGFCGHVISSNSGTDSFVHFWGNTNNGSIHATQFTSSYFGAMVGYVQVSGALDFDSNINNGEILANTGDAVYDPQAMVGGVVGNLLSNPGSNRYYNITFSGNTNNGNFELIGYPNYYIGGILGSSTITDSGNLFIRDNINNGNITAEGRKNKRVGGLVGVITSTTLEHGLTHFINNTNGGNILVKSKQTSQDYIGGFMGCFTLYDSEQLQISNIINTGSIQSTGANTADVGGLLGLAYMYGTIDVYFNDNINKGLVDVVLCENGKNGYVTGLAYLGSTASSYFLSDNANYGNVIFDNGTVTACGLICLADNNINVKIENCVNNATVKGTTAYGIAQYVSVANNLVSSGEVIGTSEAFSFWQTAKIKESSLYGFHGDCLKCDDNVTLIMKDSHDGRYHTVNGSKPLVDALLNKEAEQSGYHLRWDRNLFLREPIVIHIGKPFNKDITVLSGTKLEENDVPEEIFQYHLMEEGKTPSPANEYTRATILKDPVVLVPYFLIGIDGEVKEMVYLKADAKHNLGSVERLNKYLKANDYVVGDMDKNIVLDKTSVITGDINIIVMEVHAVEIEMKEKAILADGVDHNEVAQSISSLTGIDVRNLLVELELDKDGYVLRVVVYLKSDDLCNVLVNSVNELVKEKQCSYGTLCQAKIARIRIGGQSIEGSVRLRGSSGIIFCFFLLFLIL